MYKKEQLIPFEIKHMDSLGQGVSHHNDQVCFITKTLPGEAGNAVVYKKSKKVQFAKAVEVSLNSKLRIRPTCEHFSDCTGCSYLHTDYKTEFDLKVKAANHQMKRLGDNLNYFQYPAPERLGYRNRIQLHYKKSTKEFGLINNTNKKIIKIPKCKIIDPVISDKLFNLYENEAWLEIVKNEKDEGHIEIQSKEKKAQLFINQDYAAGGFTQVNAAMNNILKINLNTRFKELSPNKVLDLFGGNGNLTESLDSNELWVVDHYDKIPNSLRESRTFISQNIYHKNAIDNLEELIPNNIDLLVLDPPRSGLKNLNDFVKKFNFKHIIYISCFYPNMIRDIAEINENYRVRNIEFYDFFPSTYHLEVLAYLERI